MRRLIGYISLVLLLFPFPSWSAQQVKILVLPFKVYSVEDIDKIRRDAEEIMASRLSANEGVMVLFGEAIKDRLPVNLQEVKGEEAVRRTGRLLGVDYVLWGSLTKIGRSLSLDARITDVSATRTIAPKFIQASSTEGLFFKINDLIQEIVGQVLVRVRIAHIIVRGNRRIGEDAILLKVKSREGDFYSPARIEKDIQALYGMGYFEDVRVEFEDVPEGRNVIFVVKEKPSIRQVLITGNHEISTEDLRDILPVKEEAILNFNLLQEGVEKIREKYREEGYYGAKVEYEISYLEKNEVGIVYKITEGEKHYIKEISFQGNAHFPPDILRSQMETKERGLLSFILGTGILKKEVLKEDIERLSAFYYNHGFIHNRVGEPKVSVEDGWIKIKIPIEEGDQYRVGSFELEGELIVEKQKLLKRMKVRPGQVFNRELIRQDVLSITEFYADRGYAFVDVSPQTRIDEKRKTVSIVLKISKNRMVHIGRISIVGNVKTRDKVIRRELLINEGDLYSSSLFKESTKRLKALQYFEEVDITTQKGPSEDILDVTVKVKEKETGSFSVGAGYSSIDAFVGYAEVSQSNLFGKGYKARIKAEIGGKKMFFDGTFIDPWFMDTRISMRMDGFNLSRELVDYTRDTTGGSIQFGFPLLPRIGGLIGYRGQLVEVKDVEPGAQSIFTEGASLTSSLLMTLTYNSLNKRIFPTKGIFSRLDTEFAGLGGDNRFGKFILNASWFIPFIWDTVFRLRGEIGFARGLFGKDLPIFERFFLGGINSIRGFEVGSIGPTQRTASGQKVVVGGDKEFFVNLEYIFPLIKKMDLKGVVFFDMGNAYLGDIDINDLRYSAGMGIRWFSPFGPIRIEYGINLDRREGEKFGEFAFSMGSTF